MSRLLLSVDYPRCPECKAVAYRAWATTHRPGCPYSDTDPTEWTTP